MVVALDLPVVILSGRSVVMTTVSPARCLSQNKSYGVGKVDNDTPMDSGDSYADLQESEYSGSASHACGSVSQHPSQAESSFGEKKKADTEATATSAQAAPGDAAI